MYLGKSAIRSNTSQMNLTKEDGNLVMLDLQPDCVYMTRVDDTPLLPIGQAYIIGCVALGSLSLGMAAHIKILKALWTRSVVKTSNSIDFLFLAHHLVSIILHPPMFVYFILKNFYYPMSDLIGTAGCATILIGFDIFARYDNTNYVRYDRPIVNSTLYFLKIIHHVSTCFYRLCTLYVGCKSTMVCAAKSHQTS